MKVLSKLYLVAFALLICFSGCNNTTAPNEDTASTEKVVLQNILNRTSVREYQDKHVEEEKVMTLLRAGMAAPSGKDTRPWEFVVVNDRSTLDSLAAGLPYAKMLAHAPMAIIVCGDSTKSFYWYLDCATAGQNILLAAESMGLGAVWTAAYPYDDRIEAVRRHTELPEHVIPLCVIPVGYPQGEHSPKNKFDESRIHYNRFTTTR